MDYKPESFERGERLEQAVFSLPAATYNLTRILLAASTTGCVFVPIRSMQYLAVIDLEEIIFVDSAYKRWVEVAWTNFKSQTRTALNEPVAYEARFYTPNGRDIQRRLQMAFHSALVLLADRRQPTEAAPILPLTIKSAGR